MKKTLRALMLGTLMCVPLAHSEDSRSSPRNISPERISLYGVPLVCPTAPQIGCGSRSKPILLALEQQAPVAEAWLHRSGTMLAVVWKPEAKRKARASALKDITKKEELEARVLSGAVRRNALKGFLSGQGWFRGSDVDRLSEEEAAVVAARLVRRIQAKVPVSEDQAEALRVEFTDIFKRRFTGTQENAEPNSEAQVLKVLRGHLDEKAVAVLKEALPRNLRPLPGED